MNLSDAKRRELSEICGALRDESISPEQFDQFQELLRDDEEAIRFFLQHAMLTASLELESGGVSAKSQVAPMEMRRSHPLRNAINRTVTFFTKPTPLSMTVAALVVGLLITAMAFMAPPFYRALTGPGADRPSGHYEIVAEVTGLHDVRWHDANDSLHHGAFLVPGRQVNLNQGLVELTFRSGAVVVLKGPAEFVVRGEKLSSLQRGELSANIPPAAKGFSVNTPVVRIEDLGTEFGVRVAADGATDVDTFQGHVVTEVIDRDGNVIVRHDLTKDDAVSVSADAQVVQRRTANPDEFVTALPSQPLRIDFQHTDNCRTQRGFFPFTEADAPSGKTYRGPHGPLHVGISGQADDRSGFFGRNQLLNEGLFTYADLYNDFAFHNKSGTLSLTITGVEPNVEYRLRLYCSDFAVEETKYAQLQTNAFVPTGDSMGELATVTFDRTIAPQGNVQHSAELRVKSATNTLSIEVNTEGGRLTRLNGFELSVAERSDNGPSP